MNDIILLSHLVPTDDQREDKQNQEPKYSIDGVIEGTAAIVTRLPLKGESEGHS